MNDEQMKQIFAEMLESMGSALGIFAAALSHQVDPEKLHADLKSQIAAANQLPSTPGLAVRIATHALAAVEAEKMLQKKARN